MEWRGWMWGILRRCPHQPSQGVLRHWGKQDLPTSYLPGLGDNVDFFGPWTGSGVTLPQGWSFQSRLGERTLLLLCSKDYGSLLGGTPRRLSEEPGPSLRTDTSLGSSFYWAESKTRSRARHWRRPLMNNDFKVITTKLQRAHDL